MKTQNIKLKQHMNYVLITPVKNEEKNLHILVKCVLSQTILPKIWVIADDYSSDSTPQIIDKYERKFSWIKGLKLTISPKRNLDEKFGKLCNLAFRYATEYCEKKKLRIDFLVKLDADIFFGQDCIERIFTEFIDDKSLGIASPHIEYVPLNNFVNLTRQLTTFKWRDKFFDFLLEPTDGLRVYRATTYKKIGGIPETMAPDVVAIVRAKQNGWTVKRFTNMIVFKTRETSMSINNGYKLQGLRRYYLDYHPLIVMLNMALEIKNRHVNRAIMILSGYLEGIINKKDKINDESVRSYYRKIRLKEITYYFLKSVFSHEN